ncbi:MAG: UvrB/UvrC motif-containing protein [Candidatus Hydrogenedentota bacterium]|nr:MAG: UvrB/UvrC motif-containing protein [Candidatus Hydrogenedentota bacterium]
MICSICEDKVATICLKEIINNVVTELHLCQACFEAREQKGGGTPTLSVNKMLDSLAGHGKKTTVHKAKPQKCPTCETTEEQFRAKGRLGCADCYKTFTVSLDSILSKVHGSTEHRGKIPQAARRLDLKVELTRLQEDLQKAILSENYERAAKLRDKIKQFENI